MVRLDLPLLRYSQFYAEMTLLDDCDLQMTMKVISDHL